MEKVIAEGEVVIQNISYSALAGAGQDMAISTLAMRSTETRFSRPVNDYVHLTVDLVGDNKEFHQALNDGKRLRVVVSVED